MRSYTDPVRLYTIDRAPPEPDTASPLAGWDTADDGLHQVMWMTSDLQLENLDDLLDTDWPGLDGTV
eukprot:COSAG01_NODE_31200_length_601_cov_38.834661_1_plen_67_part_00